MAAAGIVTAPLARAQAPAQSATGGQILDDQALIDDIKPRRNALVVGQITQAQVDEIRADVALLVPDRCKCWSTPALRSRRWAVAIDTTRPGPGSAGRSVRNSGICDHGSPIWRRDSAGCVQVGFVQGASTISQTLSLSAGTHTLSFSASARFSKSPQPLKVMVDGVQIGALVAPNSTVWALFSIPFSVVTSGAHALAFVGTQAVDKTTFIDAIAIQ